MSQYRRASEAEALAEEIVIPVYKPFLDDYDIRYVANSGSMKSKGVDTWAKIKKASPLEKHLTGHDIILIVNETIWAKLSRDQRVALLHHEFCHVDENDEGELVMLTHDLEEFAEVVKHHGLWRPGVEHFASQLTLKLNEDAKKPQPKFDPHGTGAGDEGGDGVDTVEIKGNGRTVTLTRKDVGNVEQVGRAFAAAMDDGGDELPGADPDEAEAEHEAVH